MNTQNSTQKAEIKIINPKGDILESSAECPGSVEAIYKAVDKIFQY